jgi:hypothetical protein
VTHAHPEGIAGAVLVAVGAANAAAARLDGVRPSPSTFFDRLGPYLVEGPSPPASRPAGMSTPPRRSWAASSPDTPAWGIEREP